MKTRVGFLTPSLHMGGAERWIQMVCNHLDPDQFEIVGIQLSDQEYPSLGLHPTITDAFDFPLFIPRDTETNGAKRDHLVEYDFNPEEPMIEELTDIDVLMVWGFYDTDTATANLPANVKVIYTLHMVLSKWWHDKLMTGNDRVDAWVAVSQNVASSFHLESEIIYNGSDPDLCVPDSDIDYRKRLGLSYDDTVVVYFGRMVRNKGLIPLINAVKTMDKSVKLVVAGTGLERDLIDDYGETHLKDRYTSMGPLKKVSDILGAADVMVLLSTSEGFAIAVTESMMAGVPVVAHRVGFYGEVNAELDLITVPYTAGPEDIRNAIAEAVQNTDRAARAKDFITSNYSAEMFGNNWGAYITEKAGEG